MKQLYSLGTFPGAGLTPGDSRYSPRPTMPSFKAGSQGLRPEDVRAALPYTAYAPPPTRDADLHGGPLPVRLALLRTASAGRVLAHVVPNGGTYFAHTLLDVPATADAQLAVQTWGSPLWQRHEPDTAADLPDLPYLPVADLLDDETLRAWLQAPEHSDLLAFALDALIHTSPATRIILAAPADAVARVVYAVTRVLPHGLLADFTFSTYEPDPLACSARLVGHDSGSTDASLPPGCYDSGSVAFNPSTGRKSDLPVTSPFTAFAVHALASGEMAPLDEFRATWDRLGLTDARQFDLIFRLSRGPAGLTKDEATAIAQFPAVAAWLSARPDVVGQFLEWALDDATFAHQALSRLIVSLRQKGRAIVDLADATQKAGFAAIAAGDRARAANALEVILPMAAPARANAAWGELLARAPGPKALTVDMRWYLLPRLVRFKHANAPAVSADPSLVKWLDVSAEELGGLLALDLPRAYHLAAARSCLARVGEPTPAFVQAVVPHPSLVLQLLQPHDETTEDRAVALFAGLLATAPDRPWFEDVLANATTFPAARRNRFFEAALAAGAVVADRVIRSRGDTLLELFSGQSGLDRLGRQFLTTPPEDVYTDSAVLTFLDRIAGELLVGTDVKAKIAAIQTVRRYLDAPSPSAEALRPVADALTIEPRVLPTSATGQVIDAANAELTRQATSGTYRRDLETTLLHLGPALAGSPAGLYRELLRKQRERRDFCRQADCPHAFLAIALGAVESEELAGHVDGLEGEAFAVATDAATRGGRRLVRELDSRAASWPKRARTHWGFLAEAVRPKGLGRVVRELAFFAAGAGAASLVWFLVARFLR